MNENEKVYKLTDPRDQSIRYIGITNNPQRCLYRHMQCREKSNLPKIDWLKGLKAVGLKPLLDVIEEVEQNVSAERRKRYWIDFYLQQGEPLLNRPNVIVEMWANMDEETRIVTEFNEPGYVDVRRLGR